MQPHVETGLLRLKITNFAKVPLISTALHYWMIRTILIALERFKTGPQTGFPLNTSAGYEAVLKFRVRDSASQVVVKAGNKISLLFKCSPKMWYCLTYILVK